MKLHLNNLKKYFYFKLNLIILLILNYLLLTIMIIIFHVSLRSDIIVVRLPSACRSCRLCNIKILKSRRNFHIIPCVTEYPGLGAFLFGTFAWQFYKVARIQTSS